MTVRPPLALILLGADPARLHGALILARAELALGGAARLFVQGEAVALLRPPIAAPQDAAWRAAGEPTLAGLIDEALADGVLIAVCQSGLALAGLDAQALDPRIELTGPIAFLAAVDADTRLLAL
ncbi:MAG: DsrE family protein [Sphingomonadales bacterium]|nr:DsrE family protein [Sphingomonadales bacterium]